jgi:DNA (cytosine-5)-methyltransferase 1
LSARACAGIAPRRAEGQRVARPIAASPGGGLGYRTIGDTADNLIAAPLGAKADGGWRGDLDNDTYVTHSLRAEGFDASEDGTGRGVPPIAVDCYNGAIDGDITHSARSGNGNALGGVPAVMTLAIRGRGDSHDLEYRQDGVANAILTPNGGRAGIGVGAVAFHQNVRSEVRVTDVMGALNTGGGKPGQGYPAVAYGISSDCIDRSGEGDGSAGERAGLGIVADASPSIRARPNNGVAQAMSVRRLLPVECEKLQGFWPGYTTITYRKKPAADGPRYRALGNSMAVPCMKWIGERIAMVEELL